MIYDITPFTGLDFPGKLACIVWLAGCNMRCLYCYNKDIVESKGKIKADEFYGFLKERRGLLDAVVFSGGECTQDPQILELARFAKKLGFLRKFDTNGSRPDVIEEILKEDLASYVAMDFKGSRLKFKQVSGALLYDEFKQSLRLLLGSAVPFEVRSTVHFDLLNEEDLSAMAQDLEKEGYGGTYYLQKFLDTGSNFGSLKSSKKSFDPSKIKTKLKIVLRNF